VLRQLKAQPETCAIPVVVMRSSNEERDVVKPAGFEAFLETVSKIGLYWMLANRTPQWPQ
jgi:two-component system, response regulator